MRQPLPHPARALAAALALLPGAAGAASGSTAWTWVHGAVFVPTNSVNEAQQWDEYDPVVNDRELRFASVYGINLVRVYLHYFVYLKKHEALLSDIDDFLRRADTYGIRTEFVFFDDCWNQPPPELLRPGYRYPAPVPGVHNSRWLVCPGDEVRAHYDEHRARLKAYVQDIVAAHKADPRVAFWEIYNEPNQSEATKRLEGDARAWIRETGTAIPCTATGGEFSGGAYSDFRSWHEYGGYQLRGDSRSLCTECMNRQGQSVPGIVEHYGGRVGFILWEFGIGRDNCRFAWGENREHPRPDETPTPFHGVVYPDGHPWSTADVRALLGPGRYARTPFFAVTYYRDDAFVQEAKRSVAPAIDLDLPDEDGVGSPDASAKVPRERYSIEYRGTVRDTAGGSRTLSVDCDGLVEVYVNGRMLLRGPGPGRRVSSGVVELSPGHSYPLLVRYAHATGASRLRVAWSGPGSAERLVEPASHPEGL